MVFVVVLLDDLDVSQEDVDDEKDKQDYGSSGLAQDWLTRA